MKRVLLFLLSLVLLGSSVEAYTQAQVTSAINQVMDRFDANTQLEKLNAVIPKIGATQLATTSMEMFDILKQIDTAVRAHIKKIIASQTTIDTNPPSAEEQRLFEDMNRRRLERGLAAMIYNNELAQAAQMLADDMSEQGFFDHVSPQGVGYVQRLGVVGYKFGYVSENLVQGNVSPETVNQLWTESPVHEKNLYNIDSIEVGAGYQPKGHYRVAVYAKPL